MTDTSIIHVDGKPIEVPGRKTNVDEVLAAAGLRQGLVIRIDGGVAAHCSPGNEIAFYEGDTPSFRTFREPTLYHLRVGGVAWDWGGPAIGEGDIRLIAGADDVDNIISLPAGTSLRRGSMIDLTSSWPPQVEIGRQTERALAVPVEINGRPVLLDRPEVTFEDLVGRAFPGTSLQSAGSRALTVTYRRGPPERPQGSLIAREAIRIKGGEVFSVTATNKS